MADRLNEIREKLLAWWNKFTSKQKTLIIGGGAVIIFTFAILIVIFSQPKFVNLKTCETATEAAEVVSILESAGFEIKKREYLSQGGMQIEVKESEKPNAILALASGGFAPDVYSVEDALKSSLTTTEADKQKKYILALENQLDRDLGTYTAVKSARSTLNIPPQDGTLTSRKEESSATIVLELSGTFTTENAANMARAVATLLGNETTDKITIIDIDGNMLFNGEKDYTSAGIASSMLELQMQADSMITAQVRKVMLGTNQFDSVEVSCGLDIDFANYERTVSEFYAPDGQENGMIEYESIYESENTNGDGGVPGTYSNSSDETGYQYQDGSNSSSSESQRETQYQNNNSVEHKVTPAGGVNKANSFFAVSALSYRIIKEEDAKLQGLLDGITWNEYKVANQGTRTKMELDPEFKELVSNATGIPADNISILAYEEILLYDKEAVDISYTNIFSIVMFVIILAILGFVVLRSMRSKSGIAEEETLSVENLLQSTPAQELEDIDLESKSETRKIVEKFVDENPEAAANLLRNWLADEWG